MTGREVSLKKTENHNSTKVMLEFSHVCRWATSVDSSDSILHAFHFGFA